MRYSLLLGGLFIFLTACRDGIIEPVNVEPMAVSDDKKPLAYYLEERFGNEYEETVITFNDGSKQYISLPLNFSGITANSHTFFLGDNLEENHLAAVDNEGVVLVNNRYHITEIARVALFAINNYKKTGKEEAKQIFLNQMKWIENNFYETENYGFWYFDQDSPLYYLNPGWPSALSQGWLMNACLEAFHLTGEKRYALLVEKALKAFMVPVENGGFMRNWDEGELWFEEYSTERPSRVLNGAIFGLESVYNVYQDTKSELALKIFESGVATIKNHLQDWDAGWTSRYNLADWKNEVTMEHYHEIHIIQLLWLHRVTGDPVFKEYARKFLENDRNDFFKGVRYELPPKMTEITAGYTIDPKQNGTSNLLNDIWAFGNFWSSHQPTDLTIDFGQFRKNIKGLTLFHVNEKSKDVNFKLYVWDETKKDWRYVQAFIPKFIKDKISVYNLTDTFETYVEHFKIAQSANGRKVKLVFEATPDNIIAIRNINFIFDRSEETEHLVKVVNDHFNTINAVGK